MKRSHLLAFSLVLLSGLSFTTFLGCSSEDDSSDAELPTFQSVNNGNGNMNGNGNPSQRSNGNSVNNQQVGNGSQQGANNQLPPLQTTDLPSSAPINTNESTYLDGAYRAQCRKSAQPNESDRSRLSDIVLDQGRLWMIEHVFRGNNCEAQTESYTLQLHASFSGEQGTGYDAPIFFQIFHYHLSLKPGDYNQANWSAVCGIQNWGQQPSYVISSYECARPDTRGKRIADIAVLIPFLNQNGRTDAQGTEYRSAITNVHTGPAQPQRGQRGSIQKFSQQFTMSSLERQPQRGVSLSPRLYNNQIVETVYYRVQ